MQETPLFTIRYYNSVELMFDYTKLLPVYQKRLKLYRILGWGFLILIVVNLAINTADWAEMDWGNQVFMLLLALYMFMMPYVVKMRVKNRFAKDPTNKEAVLMMIYEDHLEIANKVSNSSMQYEGILRIAETPIGVHLFFSDVKALSIPREAVPEQAFEFLRKKIAI